jgi:hypothetical protein
MAYWKDEQPEHSASKTSGRRRPSSRAGAVNALKDDADLEADDDFDRMLNMLHAHISEFAEEHDLPVGALSPLLLDLGVTSRMMDYVLSVEKPSASGLKLDLDRMGREVDDLVRSCKRGADEFIEHSREALREAQVELEAELEAESGPEGEDQKTSHKT